MGKSFQTVSGVADNALAIAGAGNTINQDKSVQMQDDAKIVGGDNVELGLGSTIVGGDNVDARGTLTKLSEGSKIVSGIEVGPNSTYSMTSMDAATQAILDQALTIVSANANNMMAFASGRDANKALADKSTEAGADTAQIRTTLSGVRDIFTPARILAAAIIIALFFFFKSRRKK